MFKVFRVGIIVRKGRKCKAAETIQQAEIQLKDKAILGRVVQGRAGIDLILLCQWEGEVEVGKGGNVCFSRGRANQPSSGHVEAA